MLTIHPVIQLLAAALSVYVLALGLQRFAFLHFQKRAVFNWERHVVLGKIALAVFLLGMAGGLTLVRLYWHGFLITGVHGRIALVMMPLVVFGLASGLYMNVKRKRRRVLPLVHGLNNAVVLVLAFSQIYTGWGVYKAFVLGH